MPEARVMSQHGARGARGEVGWGGVRCGVWGGVRTATAPVVLGCNPVGLLAGLLRQGGTAQAGVPMCCTLTGDLMQCSAAGCAHADLCSPRNVIDRLAPNETAPRYLVQQVGRRSTRSVPSWLLNMAWQGEPPASPAHLRPRSSTCFPGCRTGRGRAAQADRCLRHRQGAGFDVQPKVCADAFAAMQNQLCQAQSTAAQPGSGRTLCLCRCRTLGAAGDVLPVHPQLHARSLGPAARGQRGRVHVGAVRCAWPQHSAQRNSACRASLTSGCAAGSWLRGPAAAESGAVPASPGDAPVERKAALLGLGGAAAAAFARIWRVNLEREPGHCRRLGPVDV